MIAGRMRRAGGLVSDGATMDARFVGPGLLGCSCNSCKGGRASSALHQSGNARRAIGAAPILLCAVLFAGCASAPIRPLSPVASAEVLDDQRGEVLEWSLVGRIAVSNGREGGSGRIDWQQKSGSYVISLSAPVTRQSWHLSGDAVSARLDGIKGGPREGADVESLLREATGWQIPVGALSNWIRGIAAAGHEYGPVKVSYGADNLPLRLEQAGWSVEYTDWVPVPNGPALPTRLVATQGQAKVKLVMDAWTLPTVSEAP